MDRKSESQNEDVKRKKLIARMIKRILPTAALLISSFILFAQEKTNDAEMANVMRSNGKIYVVVAVILTIFAGIIIYLVRLDRKMSKLEKNHNS